MTLCLNMIVKDEAHVIQKTLSNLHKYIIFDYYVICDTGSSDNTKEIIKNFYNSKNIKGELIDCEWKDFGTNRTQALEKAYNKCDYLFIFDADDMIHGNFKLPNPLIYDKYDLKFGKGFEYKRPLLINNRKKWKFVGVLHEYLICSEKCGPEKYLEGDYYIDSGKSGSRSNDPKKYEKDAEILKNAFEKETDYGLKCRYAFYTAQSYKDCNQIDNSLFWYKKIIHELDNWYQEKFYSCLMCGDLYERQNDIENSHKYYLKSIEFDKERIEGILKVCIFYQKKEQHLLAHLLSSKYKNTKINTTDKLFINVYDHHDQLDFINSISGYYCNEKNSSFESIIKILKNKKVKNHQLELTYQNLKFYKDQIKQLQDFEQSIFLFAEINNYLKNKKEQLDIQKQFYDIWNILFNQCKKLFTKYNQFNEQKRINKKNPKVFLSITTCKRFHLFFQTMNSILNTWLDVDKVDYWFVVDDNSSKDDQEKMKFLYPWIDYYLKNENEKGHASSMHIIYHKLQELKPDYWIHCEDDFLFFEKMNVIEKGIEGLTLLKDHNVKQICFNRSYGETIDNYQTCSHDIINNDYAIHHHEKDKKVNGPNCYYWPHYSFRPSIIDTNAIFELGNYGNHGFIEMDYAHKWVEKGYKTGFFNELIHIHIGRLTSERHDKDKQNAYNLNETSQFGENASKGPSQDLKKILANDYIFLKGKDQIGNDAGFVGDLDGCVEECMNKKELIGFNSLGFLKKELTELSYSNYFKENDGMYIKKEEYSNFLLKQNNVQIENIKLKFEKKEKSPFIKIINLEIRQDRKEDTQKKLLEIGFQENEFEFIKATNGYELKPSREMYELFKGNDFAYRKGIVGCAYSHYYLWKKLLEDDENDFYLILEDDIELVHNFKKVIEENKNELNIKELIFFGYHMHGHVRKKVKSIYDEKKEFYKIESLKNHYVGGTFCYSINKKGAKYLLEYIKNNNIKNGIDYLMGIKNIKIGYECVPHIVYSDWHDNNKEKKIVDSDIQNNLETFDFKLYEDKPITIAFHDNCLCERGTTVAVYNYAYYNKLLLGNKSIILHEKNNSNNNENVIQKFKKEFNVYDYDSWNEVDEILKDNQVSILYIQKFGFNDNKLSKICKNVVHCVFDCIQPHGDIYSSISHWVKNNNGKYPVVPYMINLPNTKENIRTQLNIPKEATVFGRYGGYEQFDIQYVKEIIIEIANENPNYYFIFVNTRPFSNNIKNIIYLDKIIDLEEKVKFINSCDAMIWGRSDGETFGSAIAEFSTQNKPIIACKYYDKSATGVFDVSHVHLLGNKALWYKDKESLKKIVYEFNKNEYIKKDWNAYKEYTPNKVMKKFKEIYIDNKNEDLVIDKIDNFKISHYENDMLCRGLKYGKYWEPHIWKFIEILYNNYQIENIIDIGANIGYHSLYFSKHVKNKVYAFEPHPQVFNVLENNIKLNNIENINIINKCVGDKDGTVFMSKLNLLNESNHGDIHILNKKSDYQIESIKLDDYKFNDIDLIKIDVQGYELMVLNGGIQTILNNKPIIIIEIEQHQLNLTHTKSQEIINFFNNNEYEVYLLNYSYLSDYICIHKNNIEFKDIFKNFIKENNTNNKFISGDINIKYMIDLKYDIYQDFIFIEAKDQMNNDLYFHKKPLQELMKIALDDPNCTGFNSLGYFKYEIDELKPSSYFKNYDGIFIKKKKVAYCLYGQPRDYKLGFYNINKFINKQKDYKFDLFYHGWRTKNNKYKVSTWNSDNDKNYVIEDIKSLFNNINNLYEPKDFLIEDEINNFDINKLKNTTLYNSSDNTNINNVLSQMYSRTKVINLLKKYIEDNNKKYDFIILSRFDFRGNIIVDLNNLEKTNLNVNCFYKNCLGFDDNFIICNQYNYYNLFNIYNNLLNIFNDNLMNKFKLLFRDTAKFIPEHLIMLNYIYFNNNIENINYQILYHKKYDIDETFIFIKHLDIIGSDLYFHKKPLDELMKIALNDPNCVGFNSLGYFKSNISDLKTSLYFKDYDGIYIKKNIYENFINKNENHNSISYKSQWNQDKILNNEIFKNNKNGIYIDIGAHDGILGSNSYFFEKILDWKGICIEANPNVYKNLVKNRDSINLNCAVFNKNDKIEFSLNEGYTEMLSGITETYDKQHLNRIDYEIKLKGGKQNKIKIDCFTLNHILNKYNFNIIDYLSIDTEGSEKEIITHIDFNKYHINVIDFEVNYKNDNYEIIKKYLIDNNFNFYKKLEGDDIYINKKLVFSWEIKKNIKILGNWCSSQQLIKEWSIMNHNSPLFNSYQLVEHDENIDYYVIVNKPQDDKVYYDPSKTIVFQMEPWVEDNSKNWGVKTWGKWAKPDFNQFLHVHNHQEYLNNVQWQIEIPQTYPEIRKNQVFSILSEKNFDTGHQKRIQFIQYLEKEKKEYMHVFGRENYHQFNSYQGQLKENKKENEYVNYKYVFACENNSETNYATEKIWEPILCECLPFYWGCPNLKEYIDEQAFIILNLDDFEGSMKIVEKAIQEDWWSQRINIIKKEKQKIIEKLGFFPQLEKIIQKFEDIPTSVINLDKRNDRLDYIKEQLKIPFERFSAIDGTKIEDYFEEELFQDYFDKMDGKECSLGEMGCKLSHIKLWSQIKETTLILEDDIKVHETTFESLKNIQQEIHQLKEWDIIYLGGQWTPKYGPQSKSHMKEHTILEKHMNSMFSKETEHFYKRENNNDCTGFSPIYRATGAYMISNHGAQKLLQLMKEDIHFFIQHPLDIWLLALEKAKKVIYYDYFEHPFYQGGFDLVKEECLLKTDIQRGEKKKFIFEKKHKILEQFEFIQGKDIMNHDLGKENASNIYELLQKALKNKKCVAVNTLGYLKNNMDELKTSPYFGNNDGIYIKKQLKNENISSLHKLEKIYQNIKILHQIFLLKQVVLKVMVFKQDLILVSKKYIV
jgi:FkbM family methyltransferase